VTDQELDEIIRILRHVEEVLGDLTREPTAVVPAGVWRDLHDAVAELGGTEEAPGSAPAFARAARALEALKGTGGNLAEAAQKEPDDAIASLEAHGFSGSQLRLKVSVLDTAYANYVAHGRISEVPKNDPGWIRRTGHRIRKVLAPASTFLDSLSNVPVLSFLGFVSEAVAATEHAIDVGDAD
jgi:hypothetical protein